MSIQDLDQRFPIVDENGKATPYLMRVLHDRGASQTTTDTTLTTLQQTILGKADKTQKIIAGTGLSGGGDLSADRTLNLNAGIDLLTDVDTTTTPPTNGQALVWDNTVTQWKPGSVSGGGSGETQAHVAFSSTGTVTVNKSYNVASVTRTAAGRYRVTFTTAFADVHYNVNGRGQFSPFADSNAIAVNIDRQGSKTTTYCDIITTERYNSNIGDYGLEVVVSFQQFNTTSGFGGGGGSGGFALIQGQTLAATATTITFSAIPATYTDLVLRINGRGSLSALTDDMNISFNADTTLANYQMQQSQANGTSVSALSNPGGMNRHIGSVMAGTATAGEGGMVELVIPNYSGTTFRKAYSGINNLAAYPLVKSVAGRWTNTAAITSIDITLNSGNSFTIGSDFRLYGRA